MRRRGFLAGLSLLAAPAIIRTSGLLMPIRPTEPLWTWSGFYTEFPTGRFTKGQMIELIAMMDEMAGFPPILRGRQ